MAQTKDETHGLKRFAGNLLPVKMVNATVRSTVATAQLPLFYSHWGDNNPVDPLNVRGRDAIIFGVSAGIGGVLPIDTAVEGAFGLCQSSFGAGDVLEKIVTHVALDALEVAISEKFAPRVQYPSAFIMHSGPEGLDQLITTQVQTLKMNIRHKLFEKDAKLEYYLAERHRGWEFGSTGPGWFCPWLYATHRKPLVPRYQEITFVQLRNPIITADQILAFKLTYFIAHLLGRLISFTNPHPEADIGNASRALICVAGISPYRGLWSQSRRPDQCIMDVHIMDGIPAIVVPVNPEVAPISWHTKDLGEISEADANEVYDYVRSITPAWVDSWKLGAAVQTLVMAAVRSRNTSAGIMKKEFKTERAGILILKFGQLVPKEKQ